MKTLEINKMENLVAGDGDCFVRGVTVSVLAVAGFFFTPAWVGAATVAGTSAHCFTS